MYIPSCSLPSDVNTISSSRFSMQAVRKMAANSCTYGAIHTSTIHRWNLPTEKCSAARSLLLCLCVCALIAYTASALWHACVQLSHNVWHRVIFIAVCTSCFVHLLSDILRRWTSRAIRTSGRCNRNDSRCIISTVMCPHKCFVRPSRSTFNTSCSHHGTRSNSGNLAQLLANAFSSTIDMFPSSVASLPSRWLWTHAQELVSPPGMSA